MHAPQVQLLEQVREPPPLQAEVSVSPGEQVPPEQVPVLQVQLGLQVSTRAPQAPLHVAERVVPGVQVPVSPPQAPQAP
jgi:hypothetical protein